MSLNTLCFWPLIIAVVGAYAILLPTALRSSAQALSMNLIALTSIAGSALLYQPVRPYLQDHLTSYASMLTAFGLFLVIELLLRSIESRFRFSEFELSRTLDFAGTCFFNLVTCTVLFGFMRMVLAHYPGITPTTNASQFR